MKVLDLFSGIGGFSVGLESSGMETIAFCEIEPYCHQRLSQLWPGVPIAGNVRRLSYNRKTLQLWWKTKVIYVGPIDVICGGYPCQPFSTAGKRRGKEDDRHLWPEVFRLLQEVGPAWFIGENVAGHITLGLDQVLSDLEGEGYAAQPFVIPAVAVDAPHRRDRVWIVAHAEGERRGEARQSGAGPAQRTAGAGTASIIMADADSCSGDSGRERSGRQTRGDTDQHHTETGFVANSDDISSEGLKPGSTDPEGWSIESERPAGSCSDGSGWWPPEPGVGRVAHGIPNRAHRLRALGNSVIPQIPETIGRAIMAINP